MVNNESDFIRRINSKEENAFKELFNEYYNSLVIFAMRYVELQNVAEDIVQELFVAIWENQEHYSSYLGLKTFLYHSVRNNCLDHLKHLEVEKKYIDFLSRGDEVEDERELNDKIMKEELYKMLIDTIQELPKACRKIFEYYMQGKKNEEIAHLLGISVLTVKTQKKRALYFLRERLKKNI